MAASRGPRPAARLLRTYGGLGGGRRRGPGRGARGARVAAAPWFSPARERRRLFSSSSSGLSPGSSSSPASASDSDPDFQPGPALGSPGPGPRRLRSGLRAGPPEPPEPPEPGPPGAPLAEGEGEHGLHRHVTQRSWRLRARSQRPGPPLCSTPAPTPATCPAPRSRARSVLAGLSPVRTASPAATEGLDTSLDTTPAPRSRARSVLAGLSPVRTASPAATEGPATDLDTTAEPRSRTRSVLAGPAKDGPAPSLDTGLDTTPATCPASRSRARSVLAGLSPVRTASPVATEGPAIGLDTTPVPSPAPSLATSASLFSPEPAEEPGPRPPQKAVAPRSTTARWPRGWRASLSFHQKKRVVAEPPPQQPRSPPPLDSPRQAAASSSMLALTPQAPGAPLSLSAAQKVYRECQQDGPLAFGHYLAPERVRGCAKIGEGVFGEVFRTGLDGRTAALKVIAIEGPAPVNGSPQKTFAEILPEILISKELSLLADERAPNRTRGFIGLYAARCVRGPYPELLLRAWDAYRARRGSDNERPDAFGPEQLYVVLEFELGGADLEHMRARLPSAAAAKSLLHQVTAALAVAEAALRFEHRDLHWGNVLLRRTGARRLAYTLDGRPGSIATHGIHASIIDYTLSRLEKDGVVVFCDLAQEPELFRGRGDYQFDVYRLMKRRARNRWAPYQPYSNVLWLHYLADKVLKEVALKAPTAALRRVRRQIQAFHESALAFDSATALLRGHSLFR